MSWPSMMSPLHAPATRLLSTLMRENWWFLLPLRTLRVSKQWKSLAVSPSTMTRSPNWYVRLTYSLISVSTSALRSSSFPSKTWSSYSATSLSCRGLISTTWFSWTKRQEIVAKSPSISTCMCKRTQVDKGRVASSRTRMKISPWFSSQRTRTISWATMRLGMSYTSRSTTHLESSCQRWHSKFRFTTPALCYRPRICHCTAFRRMWWETRCRSGWSTCQIDSWFN